MRSELKIRNGHCVIDKAFYMAIGIDKEGLENTLELWLAIVKVLYSGFPCARIWPTGASMGLPSTVLQLPPEV